MKLRNEPNTFPGLTELGEAFRTQGEDCWERNLNNRGKYYVGEKAIYSSQVKGFLGTLFCSPAR